MEYNSIKEIRKQLFNNKLKSILKQSVYKSNKHKLIKIH